MKQFKPVSIISSLAVLAILGLLAFVPRQDDPLDKLIVTFQKWTETNPQEKVYLHTDKPYYAVGDTMWFKGYVTTGSRHQLSAISGALYVDLIDERDSIIRALKLPVTAGMAIGDITLGDELKQGNYRMRAYTQWMRNAGSDYFFDKTFTVGSVVSNDIITKANYQYRDLDDKPVLTATLNYTDDKDQPLANKSVQYRIVIDKNLTQVKTARTDANGNIRVNISNQNKSDLSGAYIRTTLTNNRNKEVTRDFPIKANLSQSDVQFFPESGNLINGVLSRVAFKAVGIDGLGMDVSGKIVDNDNREVAEISTQHAGMGSFFLKPEADKNYTAKISFADGSTKNIDLPKAGNDGYVLSIYQPGKDSILVRVNTKQPAQALSLNLVVQTGGEIITAQPVKIERAMTSFWLDRRAFPSGIIQFTLFDQNNQPLNERIAFIRSSDQMQLSLKTNQSAYKSKEPVFFAMDAVDSEGKPAIGNYSVTVVDENKVPVDEVNESTIFSNLLLTSDLKGYVEKPNYYFTNINGDVNRALDNLMLTQGYRKFIWKEVTANNPAINSNKAMKFPAEGLGTTISGRVTTLGDKALDKAVVSLLSVRGRMSKTTIADAEGRFKFDGMLVADSIKFAIQARTAKSSDKTKIIIDSIPAQLVNKNPNTGDLSTNITGELRAYLEAGKKQDDINERMGKLNQVHRLRQVNIRAAKPKEEVLMPQGLFRIPPGTASKTLFPKESENEALLGTYLNTKLSGLVFRPYNPDGNEFNPGVVNFPFVRASRGRAEKPISIILDGRLLEPTEAAGVFDNTTIDFSDIVKIDFVINNPAVLSMISSVQSEFWDSSSQAAILIYTRPHQNRKQYNPNIANITPKGFNKAREFYSPKYDKPGANTLTPDLRSTIYWNPYLKTGADGKVNFSFFNTDGPGTYKVIVEGINADGQLGRQVFRYKIETAL